MIALNADFWSDDGSDPASRAASISTTSTSFSAVSSLIFSCTAACSASISSICAGFVTSVSSSSAFVPSMRDKATALCNAPLIDGIAIIHQSAAPAIPRATAPNAPAKRPPILNPTAPTTKPRITRIGTQNEPPQRSHVPRNGNRIENQSSCFGNRAENRIGANATNIRMKTRIGRQ